MATKGIKLSEEHKRRISEAHKGLKKPWAGKANIGRVLSEEHKYKIGASCSLHFNDLIGQKFGLLTVIKKENEKRKLHGRIIWLCKCECGNERSISSGNLKSGNTTSCGCKQKAILRELTAKRSDLFKGQYAKNATYYAYLKRAANKQLEFTLSMEEFITLTSQNCHYCDVPPSNKTSNQYHNGDYVYNGLDRIESSKGYTYDNCVPCCRKCNTAKGAMSISEFINHVRKIVEVYNLKTFKVRAIK